MRESPAVETRRFSLPFPIDLALTLAPLRHGLGDPTVRVDGSEALRATRTPHGPATIHLRVRGSHVEAQAWGPGASFALQQAPATLGADDDPALLDARHPVVRRLHRALRGLRLCRSGAVIEALVPTILEQKITSQEARRSFRGLVRRYGEPAPGPGRLMIQPAPALMASLPYWAFHPFGVTRTRAETLKKVCAAADRLEETIGFPRPEAIRRLRAIPGVGPWTVAKVLDASFGDPDAVVLGDLHLPHVMTWALAGEARGDDIRMLELLAEFEGQRGRVMRLVAASGLRPPTTTHRRRIHRIAAH